MLDFFDEVAATGFSITDTPPMLTPPRAAALLPEEDDEGALAEALFVVVCCFFKLDLPVPAFAGTAARSAAMAPLPMMSLVGSASSERHRHPLMGCWKALGARS